MQATLKTGTLAALLAVAVLAAGCGGGEADTADAKEPAVVVLSPENVLVVQAEQLRSGPPISGNLTAERSAAVRAEMGGAVLQVMAEPGQAVSRGQVLARIDDAALRDAVISAQSAVRSASTSLDLARRNTERSARLAQAGAIADRDLETARSQQALSQSQLAEARARLAQAQEQAGKTTIRSPISGVVSERPVNAGDVVAPGAALFTVVDPGSMRVEASVPAARLGEIRMGAPVRFTVSSYPGRTFEGKVQRINPAADVATGQVPVLVSIPNTGGALVAGLFAEGRIASVERQAILVPATAVDQRGTSPGVLRIRAGRVERVPVQVGETDSETERVEIVSGLAAGDTILTGAAVGTTPGTQVTVGRAAPGAAARR
ncbi:MAG TPA: efflux RND transporter periplasmic adaptor subunit [Longimicrobiaceae bacterium]